MRYQLILSIALSGIIVLSGCQEDFLEEEVFSTINVDKAFANPEDALLAVNGIYAAMQSEGYYGRDILHLADMTGGTARGYWGAQYDRFLYDDGGGGQNHNRNFYIRGYQINLRANNVIENVPKGSLDEDIKAQYVGEARFLRALNYFNLVRLYGNIPLVLELPKNPQDPESLKVTQNSRDEVYAAIIEDLEFAREALPERHSDGYGRATWGAATALLAKVYLTYAGDYSDPKTGVMQQGDASNFSKAEAMAREVVESGLYSLENNYRNVFDNATEDSNLENIFSIRYSAGTGGFEGLGGEGSTYPTQHAPKGSGILSNEWKTYAVSPEFVESFDPADNRFDYTFLTSYISPAGLRINVGELPLDFPHVNKYLFESVIEGPNASFTNINDGDYGDDFIVLRYADVLLMLAEANNEISAGSADAVGYLNQVRERAGLNPVANLDQQGLRDAIFEERRKELCFEGHAWFDLIRTGRFLEFIKNSDSRGAENITERNRLFPIPAQALLANSNLEQNFGY